MLGRDRSGCSNELVLFSGGVDGSSIDADQPMPKGEGFVSYDTQTASNSPNVTIDHAVVGYPHGAFLKVTSDSGHPLKTATVNFAILAPFMSGSGTFSATGPLVTQGATCVLETRDGTLDGHFAPHLDGLGSFAWIGSDNAQLQREHS